ncbi:MAG TPA: tail fiber domain-containing protein, partial [Blastocatellia bacterium]|nr:tail fiber domain-containing protein [Blastocatellia bacterium]
YGANTGRWAGRLVQPQNFVDLSSNQTAIGGNKTFTGTVAASSFSGSGASLTGLNAGNISSGVLGIANGGTGSSTQNFVDLSSNQTAISGNKTFTGALTALSFSGSSATLTGTLTASSFSGSGSSLTALNAGNISSGTLADARLSSNVALLGSANTFTADQTINANLTQSGTLVQFTPTNGFVAKGTFNSGLIPATGSGVRMMWYPGAAAFRAGYVSGTQWDTPGDYSTAFGYNAKANGSAAFAAGYAPSAGGDQSVAIGDGATASGNGSIAIGITATATQLGALALGFETTANGHYSTAMGNYASANGANGGFIFGDLSTTSDINATRDNQFVVRAQQMWFGTNNNVTSNTGRFLETSTGAYLTTGGAWTNSSSRALKTNFTAVNSRDVLRKVLQLPIQTWNYKAEDAKVRHIGAISQDFHGLFGFGDSAETISTVDADGVALAAIQGLHEELKDRDAKIERLERQLKGQQALIDGLRKLLCAQNPQADVCRKH